MSKYKPGETSEAVTNRKNAITISIAKKCELINSISYPDDIYASLNIRGIYISEAAVHKWVDDEKGIISYSWNTARAEHNAKSLKLLKNAIKNANERLAGFKNERYEKPDNKAETNATIQLKKENSELKIALAEVYRSYMQLVERFREDQLIDNAIRTLVLDQARILGKHRVREVEQCQS